MTDSSITLEPDGNEGRPNPFAPLGQDITPAPVPVPIPEPEGEEPPVPDLEENPGEEENSDTIVPKNTFSEIIKFLDQNEEVGLLSPKLVNNDKDHSLQLGSFGKFSTPWRILLRSSRKQSPLNSKGSFTKVDWVSGAAMVIRHNLFTELKGFDENIFLYFEDEDLCRRANYYDFDTVVLNNAEIVHLNGQSTNSKKRTNYYDQSQDYFIDKYFGVIWASLIHVLRIPYRLLR